MNDRRSMFRVGLALVSILMGLSGIALAQNDPCAGATGAAYGLCSSYCVHMECEQPGQRAAQAACHRVAAHYQKLVGSPIFCSSLTEPQLVCTCSSGILTCSASGLEAGVEAFLNVDLTAYGYGQNGVGDALTDAQGNVQFPSFDVGSFLATRNLTLTSVLMKVTNQPGMTLAQANVPVCTR